MKHTPTPYHFIKEDWTIRSREINHFTHALSLILVHPTQMADYKGSIICSLVESHGNREHALEETETNARFIITACNSHDELLEEHKQWAKILGHIFIMALQSDYEALQTYARVMKIEFKGGSPSLKSEAIAKIEGGEVE